jgi:hypothetical protein
MIGYVWFLFTSPGREESTIAKNCDQFRSEVHHFQDFTVEITIIYNLLLFMIKKIAGTIAPLKNFELSND